MAIGFRGAVTGVSTSANIVLDLTALTGGSGAAALADDVVYVWGGRAATVNDDVMMNTAGYTELADLFANDSAATNAGLFRKAMGGTPDTQASIAVTGTSVNGAFALALVFSGVDVTTPEDATTTTAGGSNGNLADPPAITPVTAGAWPVAFYAGATAGTAPTGPTAPAGLTNWVSVTATGGSSRRGQGGAGTKTDWTSGAFDPDPWSGTTNAASDSWLAATIVLRPAASGTTLSASGVAAVSGVGAATAAAILSASGAAAVSAAGAAVAPAVLSASGMAGVSGAGAAVASTALTAFGMAAVSAAGASVAAAILTAGAAASIAWAIPLPPRRWAEPGNRTAGVLTPSRNGGTLAQGTNGGTLH